MLGRIFVLSALAAGLSTFCAQASVPSARAALAPVQPVGSDIRLAQYGDVEVHYDAAGRRVIVDSYTGEIIAVEEPRRAERRPRRDVWGGNEQERYYLDDPEDMRRLRERQRGDDFERFPEPYGREYEDYSYGERTRELDEFPDVPRSGFPEEPPADVIAREPAPGATDQWQGESGMGGSGLDGSGPIERRPLDGPMASPGELTNDPANVPTTGPTIGPAPESGEAAVAELPPPSTSLDIGGGIDPSLSLGGREDVAALQVLLDRRGASPGVIDGRFGSNVDKAIIAYRAITGENLKSTDTEGIRKALAESGGDPFTSYTITAQDAAGPFIASVPSDYGEKAQLEKLGYTSVQEMLAERFHMDEAYLKVLNPEANFSRPGTIIRVTNIGQPVRKREVARIVADKGKKQVFAYDADNKLVVAYPATIGSTATPSPSGTHAITRIATDPDYTYNPNINFKQGDNDKILVIPPGPNGPVGNVWIALDKPTYGIHGTPDPAKIGKTESNGCVRLANWDAQELAKLVKPGVPVEFVE